MEKERASFRVGVNALVLRDKMLLFGNRKGDDWPGGGGWGLPGGHLEDKELMHKAVARELEEETGLHAEKFVFNALVNNVRNRAHYLQIAFLAHGLEDKEPELREPDRCYEWKWFSLDKLPEPIFIGHQDLIKAFLNNVDFLE